ncbi:MAG: anaerobic ribonucleoside-triphosphate reductase activating protein [Desulfuromonadaceae bacterium]|nr:anaerobic ribonucleoside-triphosphate reductase activating protein [Desulfuromonadaceae bacterium]
MSIKGFQGTSLLDYPARIASLVFYSGCNMRCAYCHNAALVETPEVYPDICADDLFDLVAARRGFIDAVVISGGEPTLDGAMPQLVERLKSLDLRIKLDTNGLRPQVVEALLQKNLLDFVSLDLKTAPERYLELGAPADAAAALRTSVSILCAANIDIEFRTTCMPGYVETEDIHAVGALIGHAGPWVLQQFVPEYAQDERARAVVPHSRAVMQGFLAIASQYADTVTLRGMA